MTSLPPNLTPCDPHAPVFPRNWKESYFRRNYDFNKGGYVCLDCKNIFSGVSGFQKLHGDHIIPRSRGGLTVWENLTLRCGPCNLLKSNKLF